MNTKETLFIKVIEGLKVTRQFKVTATEATENNKLKEGYIEQVDKYDKRYYRFDEEFLNANRADFEALANYENANNIIRNLNEIKLWIRVFGILTIIGAVIAIITALM